MFLTQMFKNRAKTKNTKTCIHSAFHGDFKAALELVDRGVDINCIGAAQTYLPFGGSYKTPMTLGHAAVRNCNFKAFTAFLEKGLDVDIKADGKPVLMYAIEQNQEDMALALLARGAKVDYVRHDLETPLSLAEANGFDRVVEAIKGRTEPPAATAEDLTAMKPLALKKNLTL